MKYSSGIIRRMDDFGQVVIPKDIRKKCGINEGAPLEMFIQDNSIILTKYDLMNEEKETERKESEKKKMDIQAVLDNFGNFTIDELKELRSKANTEVERRNEIYKAGA